ncbi:MAG: sugar phosphate isomerase/epimerase [Ruminococcaceae bacterium]|nr:sugar phosphate isomerase/epimerase [Oscillospiraceae bacterium]
MKTRVGLQLYSIRQAMQEDYFGSLEKVKEAGYDCVEFAGYGGHSAEKLRAELDRIGLEAYSSHVGANLLADELDEVVAFSRTLGLSWVICPGFPIHSAADCKTISDILVKAARALEPHGIRVGYHNHHRELVQFDGQYAFNLILQNDAGIQLVAEVDTCWVQYADVDPVAYIDSLGKLAGPLHFKDINADYKDLAGKDINVEVGNGMIDFPAIIEIARKHGTLERGLIVEQEAFTRDMFESIGISCANIRRMLNEG